MTNTNDYTHQYGHWIHEAEQATTNLLGRRLYSDIAERARPSKIARALLSRAVLHRFPDIFPVTGSAGDLRICSVLFYIEGTTAPQKIDALGALQVRDRLVRLQRWHARQGRPTARTAEALSFCKGVLGLLRHHNAEAFDYVTEHLYPFTTAPRRPLASTRGRYFYGVGPN